MLTWLNWHMYDNVNMGLTWKYFYWLRNSIHKAKFKAPRTQRYETCPGRSLSIAGLLAKTQVLWLQSVDSPCGYKLHTQFEQRQDQQPEERMFLKSKSIHGLGCRSSLEIAESKHMVRAWMRWKADRVRCMAAGLNRIDSIIWVVGHWHFHEVCLNYPSNRQRKQKISSVHKQYTHLKGDFPC
jgi:hypothetical protein